MLRVRPQLGVPFEQALPGFLVGDQRHSWPQSGSTGQCDSLWEEPLPPLEG